MHCLQGGSLCLPGFHPVYRDGQIRSRLDISMVLQPQICSFHTFRERRQLKEAEQANRRLERRHLPCTTENDRFWYRTVRQDEQAKQHLLTHHLPLHEPVCFSSSSQKSASTNNHGQSELYSQTPATYLNVSTRSR